MKKKIIFLFLIVFVMGINIINAYAVDDKTWFIKKDEQGNLITNAEFEMYSLNGNNTFVVNNESNETESLYSFTTTDEVTYEKGLSFLNEEQKAIINSIKTYNDFNSKSDTLLRTYSTKSDYINNLDTSKGVIGHIERIPNTLTSNEGDMIDQYGSINNIGDGEGSGSEIPTDIDYISLTAVNFMVLEETRAPLGMERNKYVVPLEVTFYMTMNEQGNLTVESTVYKINNGFYKYNSSLNYNDLKATYTYLSNNSNSEIKTGCDEDYNNISDIIPVELKISNTGDGEGNGTACSHNPVIIDKVGTYEVNVTSYVNDNESVNALKQDVVRLKVKLTNNGTVDSFNNVIVSHIPEGLTYVEESVSDNGEYDEIAKTVTWNVDRLNASSSKELTYDVKVPNNVKVNSNIITNASLNSDNVTTAIVSNNSTIKVKDFVNPKTGDLDKLAFVIALTIATSILYILHGKNKFMKF